MKLKNLLSEIAVEQMKVYSNPYATAFKPMEEDIEISKDDMEKLHSDGEVEVDGEKVTFEEGKKRFKRQDGIGKAKYTISYHDGKKKHKDGSDFFDIKIFKNKKDLSDFVGSLVKQGYVHESLNEAYIVTYAKKKGEKPASAAFQLRGSALSFEKDLKKDGYITMVTQKKVKGIDESVNEANAQLNKKVKKYLDDYLRDEKKNSPEHQEAIMLIMRGALTDANFHSEARELKKYFPKAKGRYIGTPMEDVIEDKGIQIAKWAKWDGYDIIDAFAFYTSMSIGGSFGAKFQSLKESLNENDGVYFKSYTAAIEAARAAALKKGFEVEDDEMFTKVGMNSKRPSVGKTTKVSLELVKNGKPQRKMLHIQVYGMKNGYELNSYIN